MRLTVLIATLFIGGLLSACTRPTPIPAPAPEPSPVPAAQELAPAQMTDEVLISGRDFKPGLITVSVGTKVTWTNQDGEQHTVTSSTGLFEGIILPFGSFSYTFTERGRFEYHCNVHAQMGMNGAVIVE